MIASPLSKDVKTLFELVDIDHDGKLTFAELAWKVSPIFNDKQCK
jgi:Ca2+-binding EF-hand superfamily protein